jgi:hypothetical protein
MIDALAELIEAEDAAAEYRQDVWQFAVSLSDLNHVGAGETDMRRLLAGGYAEHGFENSANGDCHRSFHPGGGLRLTATSCFIVTTAGRVYFDTVALRPRWDRERRELWVGDVLVKTFWITAVGQERILAAFEEDGWPARIDDPLPPVPGIVPRDRLHNILLKLNRTQSALKFFRDGTGEGITWKLNRHFRARAVAVGRIGDKLPSLALSVTSV